MSSPTRLVEVPVRYFTAKSRGAHGKFKYQEHHITEVDGVPAIHPDLIDTDTVEIKDGGILIPETGVGVLGEYAVKLASGISQAGVYRGQKAPEYNCATFVHDMLDVSYDPRRIGEFDGIGQWQETPMDPSWQPEAGEAVVYRFDTPQASWTHWALGVGDLGVLGVTGANGATLSAAQSADYAKGLGHTIPHLAVPEQ